MPSSCFTLAKEVRKVFQLIRRDGKCEPVLNEVLPEFCFFLNHIGAKQSGEIAGGTNRTNKHRQLDARRKLI